MATGSAGAAGARGPGRDERLSRVFLGIAVVELLAIASLYWVGVHFSA
jgi:hypothetical protein